VSVVRETVFWEAISVEEFYRLPTYIRQQHFVIEQE